MSQPLEILHSHGYERVYFYHIRRVGGTSLNETFFQLNSSHPELVSANMRRSNSKIMYLNGIRYIGANLSEIERGIYFYGFSHIPAHEIKLPLKTFTIAIFRDPVARVVSHYRMVLDYERRGIKRYWMPLERQWLGSSFSDFCSNMPRSRLHAQLFMFSKNFNVSEAVDVINKCHCVFRTEDYINGLKRLSNLIGFPLSMRRSHKNIRKAIIHDSEISRLHEVMAPEYKLLKQITGGRL